MKNFLFAILLISILSIVLPIKGFATVILDNNNPSGEADLYSIWNDAFGLTSSDDNYFTSSQDLFETFGLADSDDDLWYETNGGIHLKAEYAGYWQNLGILNEGETTEEWLVEDFNVPNGSVTGSFNGPISDKNFYWVEGYDKNADGTIDGKWYSDDRTGSDHFVAIKVPQVLIDAYFSDEEEGHVWFLAWEDLNLGDKDYNDLVVIVSDVAPVPEPATMVLLGFGLIGIAFANRKKLFKK